MARAATKTPKRAGVQKGELVSLATFCERMNLGRQAWKRIRDEAAENGITIVRYTGSQGFVDVDQFDKYLDEFGNSTHR